MEKFSFSQFFKNDLLNFSSIRLSSINGFINAPLLFILSISNTTITNTEHLSNVRGFFEISMFMFSFVESWDSVFPTREKKKSLGLCKQIYGRVFLALQEYFHPPIYSTLNSVFRSWRSEDFFPHFWALFSITSSLRREWLWASRKIENHLENDVILEENFSFLRLHLSSFSFRIKNDPFSLWLIARELFSNYKNQVEVSLDENIWVSQFWFYFSPAQIFSLKSNKFPHIFVYLIFVDLLLTRISIEFTRGTILTSRDLRKENIYKNL